MSLFPIEKVRQEWISACVFHPLSNREVLDQVVQGVKKTEKPVLLLDLDSTLYEVGSRSYQIMKEWVAAPESRTFPIVRERFEKMTPHETGYSLKDTFNHFGFSFMDPKFEAAFHSAKKFWTDRFFTNEYLSYDHAYPGAAEFVNQAFQAGAELIYLTGRDEPGMGQGTRDRIRKDGFPFDQPKTHLLLKKAFELDDLEHKSEAADYVKKIGNLVASFENEPPNLVALSDIFPTSMHVFVDTIYSDKPARPKNGLYRITGFKD